MKFEQLAVVNRTGNGLLHQPMFVVGQIAFEVMLALWLTLGVWTGWTAWLPAGCFGLFAMAALYQALAGAESCGCFGRIKVNPWLTFALDATLTAALCIWRPRTITPVGKARWGWRLTVLGVAVLVVLGASVWRLSAGRGVGEQPGIVQAGSFAILEPEKWVGKPLPLLGEIDNSTELNKGRWLVLLYHHDCSSCREAIPLYCRFAESRTGDEPRLAFVAMPPIAPPGDDPVSDSRFYLRLNLRATHDWFATTPVVVALEDGRVVFTAEGEQAILPPKSSEWSTRR